MAKLPAQSVDESSTPTQEDGVLRDLRAKYEQTVLRNNEAKARLAQVSSKGAQHAGPSTAIGRNTGVAASRQRLLDSHLENLRLQKRYKNLRLLSQYAEQADHIASDEGIFDLQQSGGRTALDASDSKEQAALTVTVQHLEALHGDTKSRTADLEIALVRARQQLKAEQTLLEKARNRSNAKQNGAETTGSGFAKQLALEATTAELQSWIAESLARCEQEINQPTSDSSDAPTGDVENSTEEINASIDTEYEQYLEARIRLVGMAKILRAPLVGPESESSVKPAIRLYTDTKSVTEEQKQRLPLQRAPHLRHKSRVSLHKLAEQTRGPSLTRMESSFLPAYHHQRLLNMHMTYLQGQTAAQDARLLQGLGLLSHESHLLPSYPLPSTDSAKRDRLKDQSQQQLDIEHLLGAWGFASDTAEEVLKESVLGNAEETKESLERARQHLQEIQIMEAMRKEVAMI